MHTEDVVSTLRELANDLTFQPNLLTTADEMLKHIDDFLVTAHEDQARYLIDVLGALRGPDNGNDTQKKKTTAVIRNLAFPRRSREYKPVSRHNDLDYQPEYWFAHGQMVANGSTLELREIADKAESERDTQDEHGYDRPRYDVHFWAHVDSARRAFLKMERSTTQQ